MGETEMPGIIFSLKRETARLPESVLPGWIIQTAPIECSALHCSCTAFEWKFCSVDVEPIFIGGTLRAFLYNSCFMDKTDSLLLFERSNGVRKEFKESEEAIGYFEQLGWGKPPYLEEVIQRILNLRKKGMPEKGTMELKWLCLELRMIHWDHLVRNYKRGDRLYQKSREKIVTRIRSN